MSKTNEEIEQFIYDALAPLLAKGVRNEEVISGNLYPEDCRPLDSQLEDAVIAVSGGYPDQIQTGRARVNIYVPDIDCGFGRKVKDKDRCQQVASLDSEIVRLLNAASDQFLWKLRRTTATMADPEIGQHFVNVNLSFQHNNE